MKTKSFFFKIFLTGSLLALMVSCKKESTNVTSVVKVTMTTYTGTGTNPVGIAFSFIMV